MSVNDKFEIKLKHDLKSRTRVEFQLCFFYSLVIRSPEIDLEYINKTEIISKKWIKMFQLCSTRLKVFLS